MPVKDCQGHRYKQTRPPPALTTSEGKKRRGCIVSETWPDPKGPPLWVACLGRFHFGGKLSHEPFRLLDRNCVFSLCVIKLKAKEKRECIV